MSDVGVVDWLDAGIDCVCFICCYLFIFGGCGDCNVVDLELLLRRSWSLERHHHVQLDLLLLEGIHQEGVHASSVWGWNMVLMGCLAVQEYPESIFFRIWRSLPAFEHTKHVRPQRSVVQSKGEMQSSALHKRD